MRMLPALTLGMALAGCTADVSTGPGKQVTADALVPAAIFVEKCVYFTKDGVRIAGSEDCERNALGIDISFADRATIEVQGVIAPIESPAGITGVRVMVDPTTGEVTDMKWMQGTRVTSQSALADPPPGSTGFDLRARKITDARWIGGGAIAVPKDANDAHYFVPPPNT